jgi:hypothetical protein
MISADFLAGTDLDSQNPETLLFSMILQILVRRAAANVSGRPMRGCIMHSGLPKLKRACLDPASYGEYGNRFCDGTAGVANCAEHCPVSKSTTKSFAAYLEMIPKRT